MQMASAIDSESIMPFSVLHSEIKKWLVAYFKFIINFEKKKICLQIVEKNTLKSCSNKLKSTFLPYCRKLPRFQMEELMLQNMAYRPTLHRTGCRCTHTFIPASDQQLFPLPLKKNSGSTAAVFLYTVSKNLLRVLP